MSEGSDPLSEDTAFKFAGRVMGRWSVLRHHIEDGIPLKQLAAEQAIGLRTLERWHAVFKEGGLAALAGREPLPRPRKIPLDLVALIEGLALVKPALSTAVIARKANKAAAGQGWPAVSYSTVRTVITGLDPGMRILAQQGAAAYRDRYELIWRPRAGRPNVLWQADHTELDILILDTNLKPARPWLTTIIDDYSRAICGYMVFLGAPSAMNTALALRQGIWPKAVSEWPMCGIPDVLYVDHGSDFTSHHLAQTAMDLHFEIIYSTIARPQGRGKVERFFGTVNTELLAELPGHLSPGGRTPEPVLTLPELDSAVGRFIAGTYHQRMHSEINSTPHQAWIADGWLPRLPASIDELNLLLLTIAKPRIVHRDGVHFLGLRYLSPLLAAYVGEQVIIRYDPRDITEIRIFHKGRYICKAVDPTHETSTLTLKEIQSARAARRRELRSQIKEHIAVVAEYLPDALPPRAKPEEESRDRPTKLSALRTYEEDD